MPRGDARNDDACFICLNEDLPTVRSTRNVKKENWICCDCCKRWFHANCGGLTPSQYNKTDKGNIWLKCIVCCLQQLLLVDGEVSNSDDNFTTRVFEAAQKRSKNKGSLNRLSTSVSVLSTGNSPDHSELQHTHKDDKVQVTGTVDVTCHSIIDASIPEELTENKEVSVSCTSDVDNILVIDSIANAEEFSSSRRILKEVHNFFPEIKVNFAYSLANGGVAIHTSSKSDRDLLLEQLPSEAFSGGKRHPPKARSSTAVFIKGVDTSVDVSCVIDRLKQKGIDIVESRRFVNRYTGKPTQVVKVYCSKQSVDLLLDTKLVINEKVCKIERESPVRVIRCFNCQRLGHLSKHCTNERRCEICAESHGDKDKCSGLVHCVNCRGNHRASSSQCPVYRSRHALLTKQHSESHNFGSVTEANCS